MQASKIVIGSIYAINSPADKEKLVRFSVSSITTTKTGNSPRDYRSAINGQIVAADRAPGEEAVVLKLHPDAILGEWTAYSTLVARRKEENARAEAEREAKAARAMDVRRLLYRLVNVAPPENATDYGQLFRVSWSGLDIDEEGIGLLLEALSDMEAEVA